MSETSRWRRPRREAGPSQKESTPTVAGGALDRLGQARGGAVGPGTPPAAPIPGQCWIVGTGATGAWAGHAGALAGWTEAGWRFAAPQEGMAVWSAADGCPATYAGGQWCVGRIAGAELFLGGVKVVGARGAAIPAPAGGTTVDAEARGVLGQVLAALRTHGLIAD